MVALKTPFYQSDHFKISLYVADVPLVPVWTLFPEHTEGCALPLVYRRALAFTETCNFV